MKESKTKKIVVAAMFAALTCVATMVIAVPSPTSGYMNLGDCIVLLSGWILGPFVGAVSAGIGSMFADIFSGYAYYAPGTFVIKALMALVAGLIFQAHRAKSDKSNFVFLTCSGLVSEVIMVAGYFVYAGLFLGYGLGAASSIPSNAVQGVFGIVTSVLIMSVLQRNKTLQGFIAENGGPTL